MLPNLIKLPPPDIAWAKVKLFVPLKVNVPLFAIVLPIVPTVSLSKVTEELTGIITVATLLWSGIALPAQLFAVDHKPSPALPVHVTEDNCVIAAVAVCPVVTE